MDWLSWNNIAREFMAWMADASVRAVVLGLLALLLIPFIRRHSTAQHAMWTLVLAGMLVLPFLRQVIPATHVQLEVLAPQIAQGRPVPPTSIPMPISPSPTETRLPAPPIWPLYVAAAYLAGVLFFGVRLVGGVLMTRRALRNTRTIHSELWEYYELVADANVDLDLEESDSVRVPLTTGSKLMRVILPADWRTWPREKLTAVLAHELAHARRRDPVIALIAAVNKCLFWFHPLAWWLEHRLPVLAEHAADDAALAVSFDAQAYARLLLDIAARLGDGGNRLVWNSAAMSGPVVVRRIRRVLDARTMDRVKPLGRLGRSILLCLGATLILVSTAMHVPPLIGGQSTVSSVNHFPWQLTQEQAAALEQELATNPEDETVREKLLTYYGFNQMCAEGTRRGLPSPNECTDRAAELSDRRVPLILWLIDHHPESKLFASPAAAITPRMDGPNVYQDAKNRWLTQVNLHPDDARVLGNASGALGADNLQERIDLLKRAKKLDPAPWTEPLARVYSQILLWSNATGPTRTNLTDPAVAAQIRDELRSSNDIALVGSVAQHVVEDSAREALNHLSSWDFDALRILARELVTHAQALEPRNREWADLMEGVNRLPSGSVPPAAPAQAAATTALAPVIRIGGVVAAANLQQSFAPVYPPDAKALGVQGTVKLQIRVGTDGHVKEATAISGESILINAAIDAALRYVYKPTMLNNKPTEVLTDVEIAFHLTQP